ncbi:vacuolar protein sorting-associated protein 41 [Sistotremastrum niveocremeum HHB9708]|uniref:Vacuolar protein sorting-associated protein 41 n=1 Tax=Sistotremastrum niveocremeum HHB9708 TaxID=1314777 RepID=A0A164NAP9_9AGAM|nr:vacuolar protein sorting-associated protein 41 [Sistotremastrum niveocremeum HHB9708]
MASPAALSNPEPHLNGKSNSETHNEDTQNAGNEIIKSNGNGNVKVEPDVVANGLEHEDESVEDDGEDEEESETEGETTDGDGEAEDDEQDEEEEEDSEPVLKYEPLPFALPDLLKRDSLSAHSLSPHSIALGTHAGVIHILSYTGTHIRSFRPHTATIQTIAFDSTYDFVASASIDGYLRITSLSTPESYSFNLHRPMLSIALEPGFAKKGSRAFVCGGMAGEIVLHEKGWLGHRETLIHRGEGPIWNIKWCGALIAWANDKGVKIYDTASRTRITYIDRVAGSPRADLFKCTLYWQDEQTLLIAWAEYIKVARIRARPPKPTSPTPTTLPPLSVEITAVFQVDSMIAGILPYHTPLPSSTPTFPLTLSTSSPTPSTSFLLLAYVPPDTSHLETDVLPSDTVTQKRKLANPPEVRIVSRKGEEEAMDIIDVDGYERYGCNDYGIDEFPPYLKPGSNEKCFIIRSPRSVVLVKPRDRRDRIDWLVERNRFEEALKEVDILEPESASNIVGKVINSTLVGLLYLRWLIDNGEFDKAAAQCPKLFKTSTRMWEDWIFLSASDCSSSQSIIPYVPIEHPRLDPSIYDLIINWYLSNDRTELRRTIKSWPKIYDISAAIVAVQTELDALPERKEFGADRGLLMDCLADLYIANRQPAKALPYFIRLRRPEVFDLIVDNNLFTAIQDQALLLVEFDQDKAIPMLVDHTYSIPVVRVVQQLNSRPKFLFAYLEGLSVKDVGLAADYADLQVKLYSDYAPDRLMRFLRSSNYYSLEKAYSVCKEHDFVPEMVFLLGRMGNNRAALTLIIERLGDVNRAIDFAKEQNDTDLWEDLLTYSESRPPFIKGLLEHSGVSASIDPIRLIRRIKNGLEIEGLKGAIIKILQDYNLQISLMAGCAVVLEGDCNALGGTLYKGQVGGYFFNLTESCPICSLPYNHPSKPLVLLFLCRHVVHASCTEMTGFEDLPRSGGEAAFGGVYAEDLGRRVGAKIALAATVRARIAKGCPVCHAQSEGKRLT